jgi:predicted metal-dependent hydrolase
MSPDSRLLLQRGVELFNRQHFFAAHEVWEDAWRVERGEPAYFLQGLIQVAAGFVKLQRMEPRGTAGLLRKGASKLQRFRPSRYGLDLDDLLADRMAASGTTDYEAEGLPRLTMVPGL